MSFDKAENRAEAAKTKFSRGLDFLQTHRVSRPKETARVGGGGTGLRSRTGHLAGHKHKGGYTHTVESNKGRIK